MSERDHQRPGSSISEPDVGDVGAQSGPMQMLVDRLGAGAARRVLQRRAQARAENAGADAPGMHAAADKGLSGAGGALPHADKIQQSFGKHDIGHIQAHTDGAAKQGANAMGAEAFATGDRVGFAGAPDLHTAAHEAAHVVQQQAGVQLKGGVGEEGDEHERHADAVADAVVAGRSAEPLLDRYAPAGGRSGGGRKIQRKVQMPGKKILAEPTAENIDELLELAGVASGDRVRAAKDEAAQLIADAEMHSFGQATSRINKAASTKDSRDSKPAGAGASAAAGGPAKSAEVGMSPAQRAQKSQGDQSQERAGIESEEGADFAAYEGDPSQVVGRPRAEADADQLQPAHRDAQFAQLVERTKGPLEIGREQMAAIETQLPLTFAQQQTAANFKVARGAVKVLWGAIQLTLDALSMGLSSAVTAPVGAAIDAGGEAAQKKLEKESNKSAGMAAGKEGLKAGGMAAGRAGLSAAKEGGKHAAAGAGASVGAGILPQFMPFVGGAVGIGMGIKLICEGLFDRESIGPEADAQKLVTLDKIADDAGSNLGGLRAARNHPDFSGHENAIDALIAAVAGIIPLAKTLRSLYHDRMLSQLTKGKSDGRSASAAAPPAPPKS
jgi:hypothetical protein